MMVLGSKSVVLRHAVIGPVIEADAEDVGDGRGDHAGVLAGEVLAADAEAIPIAVGHAAAGGGVGAVVGPEVAAADDVLVGELVIDAGGVAVVGLVLGHVGDEVGAEAGGSLAGKIRLGDELEKLLRDGADAVGGNDVAGEGRAAGERVLDDGRNGGEVAGVHVGGGIRQLGGGGLHEAEAFEGTEVEELVLADGAADAAAIFVAVEGGLGDGLRVVGLGGENGVAVEFEEAAVETVAAGFGHHNDLGVLAEFGGGGVGDHLEFRDVVERGDLAEEALADGIVIGDAVDGLAGAAAIGRSGDGGVGACLLDAGRHGHQAVDAGAAIEGHGFDLVSIDDVADGGGFGLHDGRRAADVNGGGDAADREFDIDARGLVHEDADIAAHLRGETFGGDLELVGTGGEAGEGEIAFRGGGGG